MAEIQRFRNRLDAYEAHVLLAAERMGAAARAGERRMPRALSREAGIGGGEARRRMATAHAVGEHPRLGAALVTGAINAEQARDVSGARVPDDVRDRLLDEAPVQTAEETRRAVLEAERAGEDEGERFLL